MNKKIADVPPMSDEELEKFWENSQPEDFAGWQEGKLNFNRRKGGYGSP